MIAEAPVIATQAGGAWGAVEEVLLPVDAALEPDFGYLSSVSCPPSGPCVAVGSYRESSDNWEAMLATGLVLGAAMEIAPPANAASNPLAYLHSVSCPSSGPCVAVGGYIDSSGDRQAMAVSGGGNEEVAATGTISLHGSRIPVRSNGKGAIKQSELPPSPSRLKTP